MKINKKNIEATFAKQTYVGYYIKFNYAWQLKPMLKYKGKNSSQSSYCFYVPVRYKACSHLTMSKVTSKLSFEKVIYEKNVVFVEVVGTSI